MGSNSQMKSVLVIAIQGGGGERSHSARTRRMQLKLNVMKSRLGKVIEETIETYHVLC